MCENDNSIEIKCNKRRISCRTTEQQSNQSHFKNIHQYTSQYISSSWFFLGGHIKFIFCEGRVGYTLKYVVLVLGIVFVYVTYIRDGVQWLFFIFLLSPFTVSIKCIFWDFLSILISASFKINIVGEMGSWFIYDALGK